MNSEALSRRRGGDPLEPDVLRKRSESSRLSALGNPWGSTSEFKADFLKVLLRICLPLKPHIRFLRGAQKPVFL